ncbi:hypothetical protein Kpho02_04480 [Kitasatospora phosalacinea]|uniref:Uncharacterized protein n=1 Tax=Kitasatospora phosalacinea TaxID=2065 RepID=A0A9W6UY67_9ACTN|nr:hypothetical protein [Kitasatospora phosalacinea]GLW68149.1 hypothetical protein Kpho02_04480 [Kitasatospora phosalacinea]
MARKPPGAVRALPRRRPTRPVRRLQGLPRRTRTAVHRIEALGLGAGAVAEALHTYERFLRRPGRHLYVPRADCPCCDPLTARDVLETALHRLPRPARAPLRALVERLDEEFLHRTLPDPLAARPDGTRPAAWWHRRLRAD